MTYKTIEIRKRLQLGNSKSNVLLTPEEFVDPNVDEQSMLTYLSQFPNAKLQPGAPLRKKTNAGKVRLLKNQIFFQT